MEKIGGVPALQVEKLLRQLLREDEASAIIRPMLSECRVGVLIPAYDETPETLLRPLLSLAFQAGVQKNEFEALVLVNNPLEEVGQRSASYAQNQRLLKFLRAISGSEKLMEDLRPMRHAVQIIKESGLVVHALDKSSASTAEPGYNIGYARNRGCLELAARFLDTKAGLNGIIAMTDADCRLSENFIESLIDIYGRYEHLNGLAGKMEHEADRSLPHAELVYKAFMAHLLNSTFYEALDPGSYPDGIIFQKLHNIERPLLFCGSNTTVRARSWLAAGGFPGWPSSEDAFFGGVVKGLPGDVGLTHGYKIFQLARVSTRSGFSSYGRRLKAISRLVGDYAEGRTDRLFIPDLKLMVKLKYELFKAAEEGRLTEIFLTGVMKNMGCNVEGFEPQALIAGLSEEMGKPQEQINFARVDGLMLEHIFERLSLADVTYLVNNQGIEDHGEE